MGDVQAASAWQHADFEFEEVATSVEERFARVYKTEGQVEFNLVSQGWWLAIKRLGLTLWIGKDRPAIASGDLLRISIHKKTQMNGKSSC